MASGGLVTSSQKSNSKKVGGNTIINNYNSQSFFNNAARNHNSYFGSSQNSNYLNTFNGSKQPGESNQNAHPIRGYSSGGKVHGPAGIDKVGPVLLDRGEYVVKASTVNSVEKKYPGFFDRLNTMKMNEGGLVDNSKTEQSSTTEQPSQSSGNVTVNINVSSGGATVEGGNANQQAMAGQIKEAVLGVLSQQKRAGGLLR